MTSRAYKSMLHKDKSFTRAWRADGRRGKDRPVPVTKVDAAPLPHNVSLETWQHQCAKELHLWNYFMGLFIQQLPFFHTTRGSEKISSTSQQCGQMEYLISISKHSKLQFLKFRQIFQWLHKVWFHITVLDEHGDQSYKQNTSTPREYSAWKQSAQVLSKNPHKRPNRISLATHQTNTRDALWCRIIILGANNLLMWHGQGCVPTKKK